jgi:hypothetical protein
MLLLLYRLFILTVLTSFRLLSKVVGFPFSRLRIRIGFVKETQRKYELLRFGYVAQ